MIPYTNRLRPLKEDAEFYLLASCNNFQIGKEYKKPDKRFFIDKILRRPRKEWEHLYLLDHQTAGNYEFVKVLVKSGTLYLQETWGISAEKIIVLAHIKPSY